MVSFTMLHVLLPVAVITAHGPVPFFLRLNPSEQLLQLQCFRLVDLS